MGNKLFLSGIVLMILYVTVNAQSKHATESKFMTYKGLVMVGYQGWLNCEGDGRQVNTGKLWIE